MYHALIYCSNWMNSRATAELSVAVKDAYDTTHTLRTLVGHGRPFDDSMYGVVEQIASPIWKICTLHA